MKWGEIDEASMFVCNICRPTREKRVYNRFSVSFVRVWHTLCTLNTAKKSTYQVSPPKVNYELLT